MAESLKAEERIRRRAEFQEIFDRGVAVHGPTMTLLVIPNSRGISRLGIVAGRKLGGAVRRNRAKRLIREVFRRAKPAEALDIVVIARPELLEAPLATLSEEFAVVLRQARRRLRSGGL